MAVAGYPFIFYLLLCAFFWVIPRHIKFRRRGITQKKTYNIQNTAKVWNQNYYLLFNKGKR